MPDSLDRGALETEEARRVRLDQLSYLVHESKMLERVIQRLPIELLETAPPTESFSVKERFGLLALMDEEVYRRWIEQIMAEDEPQLEKPDEEALAAQESWNEQDISAILTRVREAREQLVHLFQQIPAEDWERAGYFDDQRRDIYALARDIAQQDATHLRAMGQRLYESNMTSRREGDST